jgi:hypothetical protein
MKKTFFYILALISFAGCGYREAVIVAEPKAFFAFRGNTTGALVKIDENISFTLEDSGHGATTTSDTGTTEKHLAGTHYRIAPGKHRIQILKNGEIVVDRELLLGDGITKEIFVP